MKRGDFVDELTYMPAFELATRVRDKHLSPVEIMQSAIARIEAVNPTLNCFCFTFFDEAMSQAHRAERDVTMPACVPTSLCNEGDARGKAAPAAGSSAAIVLVLDANASRLRFYFGKNVAKAYASQVGLLMRLLLSLRAVNTSLPTYVLVSGARNLPQSDASF